MFNILALRRPDEIVGWQINHRMAKDSVRAYPREGQEMVFDAHAHGFRFFRGKRRSSGSSPTRTGHSTRRSERAMRMSRCIEDQTIQEDRSGRESLRRIEEMSVYDFVFRAFDER